MRRGIPYALKLDWRAFAASVILVQCLSVLVLPFLGCSGTSSRSANEVEGSIFKNLVLNYADQVRKNRGRVPKNQQELSQEFKKQFRDYLAQNNTTVEQLLTSPRDGKPYVFVTQENQRGGKSRVAGYEAVGVDGLRYVGLMSGDVFEFDETGFRDMVPKQ